MFRTALSQSTRSLGRLSLSRPTFAHANARLATPLCLWRAGYASQAGLSQADVQKRVLEVMKTFEKVDPTKLAAASRFKEDLGLDSLDAVEVVMAIEEEFAIEIPDDEADEIVTVQQAIDYIAKTPEAQ